MRRVFSIFGLMLTLVSCDKKDNDSSSDPTPLTPTELTPPVTEPAANPQPAPAPVPAPVPVPAPIPAPVPVPPPAPVPTPDEPAPVQSLAGLKIQTQGNFYVGQTILLKAIAQYVQPDEEKPVVAQWSLLVNEAAATIDADGRLRATQVGKLKVQAQFGERIAALDLQIDLPPTTVQQVQFWIYRQEADQLKFNSPWDTEPGHEIRTTSDGVPNFALNCLALAKTRVAALQNNIKPLIAAGGTRQLIYLVNVVPVENKLDDLRHLDRDAYFWHWNRMDSRPQLAFSKFREGSWVWEMIATPSTCLQPDETELQRYVDYAVKRLGGEGRAL